MRYYVRHNRSFFNTDLKFIELNKNTQKSTAHMLPPKAQKIVNKQHEHKSETNLMYSN
jgi:hypothetical protein